MPIITQNLKTDTKRYVPVKTLWAQDNEKVLQQLKAGFKRRTNWSKYKSEPTIKTQNRYLNHLIDPSFQGKNRLFIKMMHIKEATSDILFKL